MNNNNSKLDAAFNAWRENQPATPAPGEPHLAETDLVRLAAAGGLAEAEPAQLEHLHRCPACMAGWAAWRRAFAVAAEMEIDEYPEELAESEPGCAFGLLEAAAGRDREQLPRTLESSCGNWRLEILPERDNHQRGILVLSRRDREAETVRVTVRDRAGRDILNGSLENNRLARLCDRLDELDLSIWTVITQSSRTDDDPVPK